MRKIGIASLILVAVVVFIPGQVLASFVDSLSDPVTSMRLNAGWLYGRGSGSDAHHGVDIAGTAGTAIRSAAAGTVVVSQAKLSTLSGDGYKNGALVSASSSYVQFPTTFSSVDDAYNNYIIQITSGSAAYHTRKITDYVGATRTAYVDSAWSIVPAAGNSFEISSKYTSYGEYVIVQHSNCWTLYAHMRKRLVYSGASVSTNTQLGEMGMTGNASGVHCHFEVRKGANDYLYVRNPECWLARSTGGSRGGVRGQVTSLTTGLRIRGVVIGGASKPDDNNYTFSNTYNLMANGSEYRDETEYGINYYIGRAATGAVILQYTHAAYAPRSYSTTIVSGTDPLLPTITMTPKP